MKALFVLLISINILFVSLSAAQNNFFSKKTPRSLWKLQRSIFSLQSFWWDEEKGSWKGGDIDPSRGSDSGMIGWWNAANTIEVLSNSMNYAPKNFNIKHIINRMFSKQNISGIIDSKSFDDSGWVALSWLRAYEETGDEQYLNRSKLFFEEIIKAWDNVCGGGLYWAGDEEGGGLRYKNAVTNELFLMLSLRLKDNVNNPQEKNFYREWAYKTWDWFNNSQMIRNQSQGYWIIDGLDKNCQPTGDYWTYNQGIILGGLGKLFEEENDLKFIEFGEQLALSIIDEDILNNPWLYDGGILKESCEPTCGDSAKQFKGIFVRYLNYFVKSASKKGVKVNQKIEIFIRKNAGSLWKNDKDNNDRFGLVWKGPVNETNAIQQTSALDLLVANHEIINN